MPLMTKARVSGVLATVAFATVISVVPAQAFALPPVPLIQGSIAAAVVTGDEASLVTGPASPVVALAITSVGAILGATAPLWVPWVTSTIGNLTSGGNSPTPDIFTHAQGLSPLTYSSPPQLVLGSITDGANTNTVDQIAITVSSDGSYVDSSAGMPIVEHYRVGCQDAGTGDLSWVSGARSVTLNGKNSSGTTNIYPSSSVLSASCPTLASGNRNIPVSAAFSPGQSADCTGNGFTCGSNVVTSPLALFWTNPSPPAAPAGSAAAAPKVLTTNVHCVAPDGSTFDLSTDIDATAGGFTVPSCAGSVAGSHALQLTVSAPHAPGDTSPPNIYQVTPKKNPTYPGCDPTQPGPLCVLSLKVDGTTCVVGAAACQGWTSLLTTAPSRLECDWGTYTLPLSDCDVLERAFEPSGQPGTLANTDGDPKTWDSPGPDTSSTASPSPSASATPSTAGLPAPGIGSNPDPFPGLGNPATNPNAPTGTDIQNCAPNFASWNPIDWVFTPVLCVMKDAFIPKSDLTGISNDIRTKLEYKPPVSWIVRPPVFAAPGSSGCPDWVITVGSFSQNVVCNSTFTAAVVGSRAWLYGLLLVGMVWPLIRSVWYAAIPILRVSPSSGGK